MRCWSALLLLGLLSCARAASDSRLPLPGETAAAAGLVRLSATSDLAATLGEGPAPARDVSHSQYEEHVRQGVRLTQMDTNDRDKRKSKKKHRKNEDEATTLSPEMNAEVQRQIDAMGSPVEGDKAIGNESEHPPAPAPEPHPAEPAQQGNGPLATSPHGGKVVSGEAQHQPPNAGGESVHHAGGEPVHHDGGEPVQPAGGEPVHPAGGEPVHHAGGEPVQPAGGEPVHPTGEESVHHAGGEPVHHAGGEPVHPTGEESVHHAGGEPVHLTGEESVHHAGGEPVHPTGEESVHHAGGEPVHPSKKEHVRNSSEEQLFKAERERKQESDEESVNSSAEETKLEPDDEEPEDMPSAVTADHVAPSNLGSSNLGVAMPGLLQTPLPQQQYSVAATTPGVGGPSGERVLATRLFNDVMQWKDVQSVVNSVRDQKSLPPQDRGTIRVTLSVKGLETPETAPPRVEPLAPTAQATPITQPSPSPSAAYPYASSASPYPMYPSWIAPVADPPNLVVRNQYSIPSTSTTYKFTMSELQPTFQSAPVQVGDSGSGSAPSQAAANINPSLKQYSSQLKEQTPSMLPGAIIRPPLQPALPLTYSASGNPQIVLPVSTNGSLGGLKLSPITYTVSGSPQVAPAPYSSFGNLQEGSRPFYLPSGSPQQVSTLPAVSGSAPFASPYSAGSLSAVPGGAPQASTFGPSLLSVSSSAQQTPTVVPMNYAYSYPQQAYNVASIFSASRAPQQASPYGFLVPAWGSSQPNSLQGAPLYSVPGVNIQTPSNLKFQSLSPESSPVLTSTIGSQNSAPSNTQEASTSKSFNFPSGQQTSAQAVPGGALEPTTGRQLPTSSLTLPSSPLGTHLKTSSPLQFSTSLNSQQLSTAIPGLLAKTSPVKDQQQQPGLYDGTPSWALGNVPVSQYLYPEKLVAPPSYSIPGYKVSVYAKQTD